MNVPPKPHVLPVRFSILSIVIVNTLPDCQAMEENKKAYITITVQPAAEEAVLSFTFTGIVWKWYG